MLKKVLALLVALYLMMPGAIAQTVLNIHNSESVSMAQTVMPAGSPIHVNNRTLIGRRPGITTPIVQLVCDTSVGGCDVATTQPEDDWPTGTAGTNGIAYSSGGSGAYRLNCSISHQGYDDPIVWPGHPGITHLHTFVGNTSTSAASDLTDMSLTGGSTCDGGTGNASGYWFPTPIYHCPTTAVGCDHTRDGEVQHFEALANVYYKCDVAGSPGTNCTTNAAYCTPVVNGDATVSCQAGTVGNGGPIRWAPVGIRMIFGSAGARVAPVGLLRFGCFRGGFSGSWMDHIPKTADAAANGLAPDGSAASGGNGTCDNININVQVQSCWDGVNLDSPDHASHVKTQGATGSGSRPGDGDLFLCPDPAFPIAIMSPTMNQHFDIKNQADLDYIRLSSDPPCADEVGGVAGTDYCNGKPNNGQPAGWTIHLDWVNGWSHAANFGGFGAGTLTDIILKNCIGLNHVPLQYSISCQNIIGSPNNDGKYYQLPQYNQ